MPLAPLGGGLSQRLGLESGTVRVVEYDPAWRQLYEAEALRLRAVLREHDLSVVLEHTGSTAVPGLAGKPIIDILGGVEEAVRPRAIAAKLPPPSHRDRQPVLAGASRVQGLSPRASRNAGRLRALEA